MSDWFCGVDCSYWGEIEVEKAWVSRGKKMPEHWTTFSCEKYHRRFERGQPCFGSLRSWWRELRELKEAIAARVLKAKEAKEANERKG